MEVGCNLEREVCRAEELRRVLERCAVCVQWNGGFLERSTREQHVASDISCVEELKRKLSSLQQSHTKLLREAGHLRREVARLRQEEKEVSNSHNPPSGVIQRGPALVTSDPNSRDRKEVIETDRQFHALLLVFHYLPPLERCRVATVCRKWRAVTYHPSLWRDLSLNETTVSSADLRRLSLRCWATESISLHALIPSPASCDEDLQCYITRQRASLEPSLGVMLQTCSHSLLSLSITNCSLLLTDRTLWLASALCPYLQYFHYTSEEFPPQQEAIWSLANGCPGLKTLSLPPALHSEMAEKFDDSCLQQITRGFPTLIHLCIGGPAITLQGIQECVCSATFLQHLELVGGPQLNKEAVKHLCQNGLPSLISLTLTHVQISPQAVLYLTESCPSLQLLQLTISFSDYFPSPDSLTNNQQIHKYQRILTNLQAGYFTCTAASLHDLTSHMFLPTLLRAGVRCIMISCHWNLFPKENLQ